MNRNEKAKIRQQQRRITLDSDDALATMSCRGDRIINTPAKNPLLARFRRAVSGLKRWSK